jgi:hypothetical protein
MSGVRESAVRVALCYAGDAMTKRYTGIDHHKRFSVACTLDEHGNLIKQSRLDGQ